MSNKQSDGLYQSKQVRLDRREFLAVSATATVATCLNGEAASALTAMQSIRGRKDVRDLTDDETTKFREAVRRMKMRGPDVPVWNGTNLTMPVASGQDGQGYAFHALIHTNACPHGNWWFLPWHRIYLFQYEQVLRELVSDFMPQVPLTLPYWNWTSQREVPDIFADNDPNNPLFDPRRHPIPLLDSDVGTAVITETVDDATTFELFGSGASCDKFGDGGVSPFEEGPHGIVHVKIGWHANVPSFRPWGDLRVPPTAGFDPLFWSHHANIDRLWDVWLTQPGHANPGFDETCPNGSTTWGSLVLDEFVDSNGNAVSKTVQQYLSDPEIQSVVYLPKATAVAAAGPIRSGAMPQRDSAVPEPDTARRVGAQPSLRLGIPITLNLPLDKQDQSRLSNKLSDAKSSIVFRVQGIQVKSLGDAPLVMRSFLNKADVNIQTPPDDPHQISSLTFFGASHHSHAGHGDEHVEKTVSAVLNLSPTLKRLRKSGVLKENDALSITLLLAPVDPQIAAGIAATAAVELPFAGGDLEIP